MSKRRDKDRSVPPPTALPARGDGPGLEWLTQWAFYGALALVLARATMGDFSKSRNEPVTADTPRAAGAATSLAIDLLCCLPAVLVLSRRVMDRQYVLRWAWSVLPLGLLAGWGVLSTTWAADRFAALSAAFHWVGAFAMLWAAAQLVRSWLRLRVVAALIVGLLLAYFTYALFYRTVDLPDLKRNWERNKTQILAERGIGDDPFLSRQFENRIMSGELYGVFTSPNTMGAMVVLLLVIALGVAAQRALDDPSDRTWVALLAVVPLAGWMLVCTKSRTTLVTPLLAAGMVAAAWRWRGWLGARTKGAYWAGIGIVLLGTAAVVGHGLYHHGLVHPSLTFRWHYWVGGMRLFARHPLAGVGLDNFGPYYLGVRLPEAAEEVKDPHNLFVKFLTELGIVGGLLCLAWLGRLAWELTRPVVPPMGNAPVAKAASPKGGAGAIRGIAVVALGGFLVNVLASVDFGADKVFVVNEVLRRFGMFALLLIGASVSAIRSLKEPELEWRPAPLVLYAMLAGLAVFVVHNLIDFSLFEPGVTTLFAFVAGAALGVRQPSVAGRQRRTAVAAVVLGVSVVAWLIVGGFVWTSFAVAEDAAYAGALALHDRRAGEAVRQFDQAREHVPLNADYALRAAQAMIAENPQFSQGAMDRLALAIATNPMAVDAYLTRARYLFHSSNPAAYRDPIRRDFARAVELNPNEVSIRVEYGDALRTLGTPEDRAEAARQYAEALRYNSLLKADEPKRLRRERLAEVERKAGEK